MLETARLPEAAIGQREGLPQLRVFAYVSHRTCVQHDAGDAIFREHLRRHATRMAGANDQYIDFIQHAWLSPR